jgi:hypothetical protein
MFMTEVSQDVRKAIENSAAYVLFYSRIGDVEVCCCVCVSLCFPLTWRAGRQD